MDLNMKSLVQFAPINFLSVSEYALWKKPVYGRYKHEPQSRKSFISNTT
jgi:hypothetical protein